MKRKIFIKDSLLGVGLLTPKSNGQLQYIQNDQSEYIIK